jgi:hypothetical protein
MRQLLSLPTSLLLLIASRTSPISSQDLQWPYNLPKDVRYYPEDQPLIRRDIEIGQRLLHQPVKGIRKMSGDEGEKFFMKYWQFELESEAPAVNETEEALRSAKQRLRPNLIQDNEPTRNWANESFSCAPRPPFPFHSEEDSSRKLSLLGRHFRLPRALERRSFQCPTGTSACTSIGKPNSCCATGETCQIITDTGLGDVGCCEQGHTCSGELSRGCDSGLTSCPNNPGGGCCIPGYQCLDVGCKWPFPP